MTPQASQNIEGVKSITAATAPPRRPAESVQSPQTGPASSVQGAGNQNKSTQANPTQSGGIPDVAIHIDRPNAGTTFQGVQTLSGWVTGGIAREVAVHLNDNQQLLDVWGTNFEGQLSLRQGTNKIRVVALGPLGPLAEKLIEVQYVPPVPPPTIKILRPADGTVFDSPGQDLIEVEGEVSEPGMNQAQVVFNEFSIPATVKEGRFTAVVPAIAPAVTIRAEVHGERGSLSSDPITIRRQPFKPSKGFVLLDLPSQAQKAEGRVWLLYRAKAADVNSTPKATSHFPSGSPGTEQPSIIFVIPATQEGVYSLAFDYRVPPGESVEKGWGLVFAPGPNGYRSLRLGPFRLTGKGRVILAKFLLPHGVFWEEDSWFTGFAEGSDSLTKFRYPDGVSWTEKKGDPEFPSTK